MVTWGPEGEKLSPEEKARYMRGVEWEIEQGHSYRVKCIDGSPISWRFDCRTMKRSLHIEWESIPDWVGDRFRQWAMMARVFWNRRILRRVNPYH